MLTNVEIFLVELTLSRSIGDSRTELTNDSCQKLRCLNPEHNPSTLRLTSCSMARKRTAAEIEMPSRPRPNQVNAKRTKLSPSDDVRSNSSAPSSCSVSEDSALQSSPAQSENSRHSSISSMHSDDADERSESGVSRSSDESSEEESGDEEHITQIGGPKKPKIGGDGVLVGALDIKARLSAFLPQLAAANSELEKDGAGHSMEDVEEGIEEARALFGLRHTLSAMVMSARLIPAWVTVEHVPA